MNKISVLIFTLCAVFFAAPNWAQAQDKNAEQTSQKVIQRVFSEMERAVIEEYFGVDLEKNTEKRGQEKSKQMPPGLAKKKELPPGLQKQLEKNGVLPPGLEGRDIPDDLKDKLPPVYKGTKRLLVGDDVVLIDTATDMILDIIRDVAK